MAGEQGQEDLAGLASNGHLPGVAVPDTFDSEAHDLGVAGRDDAVGGRVPHAIFLAHVPVASAEHRETRASRCCRAEVLSSGPRGGGACNGQHLSHTHPAAPAGSQQRHNCADLGDGWRPVAGELGRWQAGLAAHHHRPRVADADAWRRGAVQRRVRLHHLALSGVRRPPVGALVPAKNATQRLVGSRSPPTPQHTSCTTSLTWQ